MNEPVRVNSHNFEAEVLNAASPVLIDFWASWCMPCRMLAPVVDNLIIDYADRLMVGKVDIDESPDLAERYRVMSIPTLILFINGEEKEKLVGVHPKEAIVQLLKKYI